MYMNYWRSSNLQDFNHHADSSAGQTDLHPVWMGCGIYQDVLDDAPGQFTSGLVLICKTRSLSCRLSKIGSYQYRGERQRKQVIK
jgi:hypothetical protein